MKVIIKENFPIDRAEIFRALEDAKKFITMRYGFTDFDRFPKVVFDQSIRRSHLRSRRFRGQKKKHPLYVAIKSKQYWFTYARGTAIGCACGELVKREQELRFALVHEFTHVIQAFEIRQFSEVETTDNEIMYAMDNYPDLKDGEHYEIRRKRKVKTLFKIEGLKTVEPLPVKQEFNQLKLAI